MEKRQRGRPRCNGSVIYLGRLRYDPAVDDPALGEFFDRWLSAPVEQRPAMLKAALIGGAGAAAAAVADAFREDREMTDALDSLLGGF